MDTQKQDKLTCSKCENTMKNDKNGRPYCEACQKNNQPKELYEESFFDINDYK